MMNPAFSVLLRLKTDQVYLPTTNISTVLMSFETIW